MEESNYIDMANNINSYLEKYCGITNDNSIKNESVEDVLTKLIHMDKSKEKQEGGIIVDDLIENLTGGNVKKENKKESKELVITSIKELDENLLEGGGKDKEKSKDKIKDTNNENNKNNSINNIEETEATKDNVLNAGPSSGSSDDEFNNDTDYSDEYDDERTFMNDEVGDEYNNFLKHYQDKEYDYSVISGGNITKNNKIQIIPMFPYLLRY